jgi:hypothetical protein
MGEREEELRLLQVSQLFYCQFPKTIFFFFLIRKKNPFVHLNMLVLNLTGFYQNKAGLKGFHLQTKLHGHVLVLANIKLGYCLDI